MDIRHFAVYMLLVLSLEEGSYLLGPSAVFVLLPELQWKLH